MIEDTKQRKQSIKFPKKYEASYLISDNIDRINLKILNKSQIKHLSKLLSQINQFYHLYFLHLMDIHL